MRIFSKIFWAVCCMAFLWGQSNAWAAETPKPTGIRLFGTIEFKGPLKGLPDWLSVVDRNASNNIFTDDSKLVNNVAWRDLKAKLEKMAPLEQLKAVNSFWNQCPYRLDIDNYKKEDYWATPTEFRQKSGDCEDYSIAKYYTLRQIGYTHDQMRIVVIKENIRNFVHAILAVYIDNKAYILDNLSNTVLEHERYKNYIPQFSVNEENRWAHVRPK